MIGPLALEQETAAPGGGTYGSGDAQPSSEGEMLNFNVWPFACSATDVDSSGRIDNGLPLVERAGAATVLELR